MKAQPDTHKDAYKNAGVDIEAGNNLVDRLKSHVATTNRDGVIGGIGGFGGLFDLKKAGYDDPVLVSATDGVGTKIKIAIETGCHDTIGIDLVAMCVNDLVVQGAEPLFFLDYFASGHLDVDVAENVIAGIAAGCREAGCALIGGETAEMPGMYADHDYDLAGFCVGAVDRDKMINGESIRAGDVVLGLASSGLHSNGFSLIRKIVSDEDLSYDDPAPFDSKKKTGEALLTPTRIYVRSLLEILKKPVSIKGLAHITGGGLIENIPRILPDGLGVKLDASAWPVPPVFGWLARAGALSQSDMSRTLNCGIGMVLVCDQADEKELMQLLSDKGEDVFRIGAVVFCAEADRRVEIREIEQLCR